MYIILEVKHVSPDEDSLDECITIQTNKLHIPGTYYHSKNSNTGLDNT